MRLYEFILMEARAEALASKYEAKILERVKRDRSFGTKEVLPFLQQLESQFGKAVEWVLLKWLQGDYLIEDLPRVKTAISQFEQKKRGLDKKDINQYKTLAELENLVFSTEAVQSNTKKEREVAARGIIVVHQDSNYSVYKIMSEAAAIFYGKGTEWCTAYTKSENKFQEYTTAGPLYYVIDRNNKTRYAVCHGNYEYRNENNIEVDYSKLRTMYPAIKPLENWLLRYSSSELINFAKDRIKGRWGILESMMLNDIRGNSDYIISYIVKVLNDRWHEYESALLGQLKESIAADREVTKELIDAVYRYSEAVNMHWDDAVNTIATSGNSEFIEYYKKLLSTNQKSKWESEFDDSVRKQITNERRSFDSIKRKLQYADGRIKEIEPDLLLLITSNTDIDSEESKLLFKYYRENFSGARWLEAEEKFAESGNKACIFEYTEWVNDDFPWTNGLKAIIQASNKKELAHDALKFQMSKCAVPVQEFINYMEINGHSSVLNSIFKSSESSEEFKNAFLNYLVKSGNKLRAEYIFDTDEEWDFKYEYWDKYKKMQNAR